MAEDPVFYRPKPKVRPLSDILSKLYDSPPAEPVMYDEESEQVRPAVFFWKCPSCGETNARVAGSPGLYRCQKHDCSFYAFNSYIPDEIIFPPIV